MEKWTGKVDWKSALWHFKQILLFLSPDNFLVATAFLCVKSVEYKMTLPWDHDNKLCNFN